jgi:hypothetical protein
VPLLIPLVLPFFVFAAAFVLVGLAKSSTAQHGSVSTPGFWDVISGKVLWKQVLGAAAKAASYIVSHFAAAQLRHLAKWFAAMGTLTGGYFYVSAEFAETIVKALERVEHRGDPKARTKAQVANRHAIHAGHAATHANVHARSVGHALNAYKARTNPRVHHLTHAVDVAIPHTIAGLRERNKALEREQTKDRTAIGEIEHGATRTWEWIRTHPLSAATGAFTGAVAIALARLGFGFMRCRSWQRLGRSLTCNDANVLADLLAAATLVVGAMNLEELARAEQQVIGEAASIAKRFWEV